MTLLSYHSSNLSLIELKTMRLLVLILRSLTIWKRISTIQHYKQLRGFPWQWKLHSCMAAVNERYGNEIYIKYILSYEQSKKIRTNYSTKRKRNAKTAWYHTKQYASIMKFRNRPKHFGPLLVPIILEKLPNTIKLQTVEN